MSTLPKQCGCCANEFWVSCLSLWMFQKNKTNFMWIWFQVIFTKTVLNWQNITMWWHFNLICCFTRDYRIGIIRIDTSFTSHLSMLREDLSSNIEIVLGLRVDPWVTSHCKYDGKISNWLKQLTYCPLSLICYKIEIIFKSLQGE